MQTIYAKLTSKGQLTLPAAVRQALGLSSGDRIAITIEEADGSYVVLRPVGSIAHLRPQRRHRHSSRYRECVAQLDPLTRTPKLASPLFTHTNLHSPSHCSHPPKLGLTSRSPRGARSFQDSSQ